MGCFIIYSILATDCHPHWMSRILLTNTCDYISLCSIYCVMSSRWFRKFYIGITLHTFLIAGIYCSVRRICHRSLVFFTVIVDVLVPILASVTHSMVQKAAHFSRGKLLCRLSIFIFCFFWKIICIFNMASGKWLAKRISIAIPIKRNVLYKTILNRAIISAG